MNETPEVLTPESVIAESNAPLVGTDDAAKLFAAIGPLVPNVEEYKMLTDTLVVTNLAEAERATVILDRIAADSKTAIAAIKAHKDAAKKRHTLWCSLESFFVDPFEAARKAIKGRVMAWQEAERLKAEAEQRRLQAQADEEARRERERLEKDASKLKTPELREQRLEQAATVIPATIYVPPPVSGVKIQKVWVADLTDKKAFIAFVLADYPNRAHYLDVNTKALNQMATQSKGAVQFAGVTFKQTMR